MYHIATVATHKEGLFNQLINNKFNEKIKVLGMGKKWTGFRMKTELMNEYIKNLPDNDIVIYIDGFDSLINMNPEIAIRKFKEKGYKILVSEDVYWLSLIISYLFPVCRNNKIANAGLYMGYVKYLKELYKNMLKDKCKDDQLVLANMCKKIPYIEVDGNYEIFQNLNDLNKKSNAVFISYPGRMNLKRGYRSIFEYSQFFLIPIFILYFLFVYLCRKNIKIIMIVTIFFIIYLTKIDLSCI